MIKIKNVYKFYKAYTVHTNTLKSFMINKKKYFSEKRKIPILSVINNLSVTIKDGDVLCIVGKNGSGKSTLAKLIAGTSTPTKGAIQITGKIVPFLELGVAFSNELNGHDNAILNGVLLGMSRCYIEKKVVDIFEFAEIQEFIKTPLKYYSSGMQMRLAFSIAMHASGDIYIFDEILAVGDESFIKKCLDFFTMLLANKKTIVFITHNLDFVKEHATKILYLHRSGEYSLIESQSEIESFSFTPTISNK